MYIKHLSCKWSLNNSPVTSRLQERPWIAALNIVSDGMVHRWRRHEKSQRLCFFLFSIPKSINTNYLINEAPYQNYVCDRTFTGLTSSFVPNGIPISFEMAEKKLYRQTNKHFPIYISRDLTHLIMSVMKVNEKHASASAKRALTECPSL